MPPIAGPVRPERPWVLYEFADPKLQALTSGQKLLLRMGSVNERRVKARLAEIRAHGDRPPARSASRRWRPAPYPRLLGDIGGTHIRFGWVPGPGEGVVAREVFRWPEGAGLREAIATYLDDRGRPRPPSCALAVAGPVSGDSVALTNRSGSFSIATLQRDLGLDRLVVLNDFAALALAIPQARARGREAGGRRRSGSRRPDRDPRSGHRAGRGRRRLPRRPAGAPSPAKAVTRRCAAATPPRTACSRSCGDGSVTSRSSVSSRAGASSISTAPTARWPGSSRRRTMQRPSRISPRNRSTRAASPPSSSSSASSEPSPATWR